MTRVSGARGADATSAPARDGERAVPVVGKQTLVEASAAAGRAPAVQRRVDAHVASDPAAVHASAARGVATPSSALPHGDRIQRLFGRHDVSSVKAHVGSDAAASARDMGAQAYAAGDHVVLGNATDLFTIAHEAAHVVQQRAGVHLKGGVGEAGDAHERQADAVAAQVVRGESAETLLGEPSRGSATAQIQQTPATDAPATAATPAKAAPASPGPRSAREREPEPETEEGAGSAPAVQQRVSSRARRGTRIVIVNRRAGDHGQHGRVLRASRHRDDCLVVEFDSERGVGYRVDCDEMNYEDDSESSSDSDSSSSPEPSSRRVKKPTSSPSDALWVATGQDHDWANCAHFAMQNFDLAAEGLVSFIVTNLHVLGLHVTQNHSEATVVFYGSGNTFSHVIRKVNSQWEEVQYAGGPHRRYTGPEDPPRSNRGDGIVLMLRP